MMYQSPVAIVCFIVSASIAMTGCSTSNSQTTESAGELETHDEPASEAERTPKSDGAENDAPDDVQKLEAKTVTGADVETAGSANESALSIVIEETKDRKPTVEIIPPTHPPLLEPRDRYLKFRKAWHKQNPDGENTPREQFGNLVHEAGGAEAWESTVRGYWIGGVNEKTLFAQQESFGQFQFIERFFVDDDPVDLVVYEQTKAADEPVDGYETSYLYTAVAFDASGDRAEALWALDLSTIFPGVMQMDDVQIDAEGKMLTNVNYQSYPNEVDGQTGWLYRVDPSTAEVMWKSEPMTSRAEFFAGDGFVLAGYGFTDVDDSLYAVDLQTGERLDEAEVPSAPERIKRIRTGDGEPFEFDGISGKVVEDDPSKILEVASGNLLVVTYDSALEVRVTRE
jgi:hypothetical protein